MSPPPSPHPRLASYVEAWRDTVDRLLALGAELAPADWDRPTDLPGWSVRDVYAHLAALESELAGDPPPAYDGPAGNLREVGPLWTQAGVEQRSDHSPEELLAELRDAADRRALQLAAEPPLDPTARPARTPGGLAWDWETLLRNRVVDVWMHEQDARRAIGRPGGWQGLGAAVTMRTFASALPYVLGKRVAPPAGTTVVWDVTDTFTLAVRVEDDGRAGALSDLPGAADSRLRMDPEAFVVLAGGRQDAAGVPVVVDGDPELAAQVLVGMAVTP